MNTYKYFIILFFICASSGCTTTKTLQSTGGSRSDGTIELSYEVGMFEKPVIDWEQSLFTASQRCKAWGYSSAEAFGGQLTECQVYNSYGSCLRSIVTVKYQCIGD